MSSCPDWEVGCQCHRRRHPGNVGPRSSRVILSAVHHSLLSRGMHIVRNLTFNIAIACSIFLHLLVFDCICVYLILVVECISTIHLKTVFSQSMLERTSPSHEK